MLLIRDHQQVQSIHPEYILEASFRNVDSIKINALLPAREGHAGGTVTTKEDQLQQHGRQTNLRPRIGKASVQSTQRRAVIRTNRQMKGVSGPKAQSILVREPRSRSEALTGHWQNTNAVSTQTREHSQTVCAIGDGDLSRSKLDRQSRGKFRNNPIADEEILRCLSGEPVLHPDGLSLIGQGRYQN